MPIRMTGLTSGLDTESIVNQLMSAQRTKQTKVENKKQKLEWKQEIWKGLNTKIYGFYKDSLSKMKYSSNYSTKKASVSDSTKLTATASTKAAAGSYKVSVNSIASAQYVTSGKLSYKDSSGNTNTATTSTKLSDLGMSSGTVLKLEVGDKSSALEVKDDTTIKDFVNFCSNAGLNATFDEKQQRFFLSSKDSGEENSFSLSANTYSSEGDTAITELNDAVGLANLKSSQKTKYNSIVYGSIASGTQISDDDKETLKSIAVSSADADAKSKAIEFYRASLNKTYDISDEEKEKIKKKYDSDLTLSGDDRTKAIADAIEKRKQSDIEEKLKTDEYKTKISEAVTKGITAEEVRKAGLAVNDDSGVEDPASISKYTFEKTETRKENAENAIESAVGKFNTAIESGITSDNGSGLLKLGLSNFDGATSYKEGDLASNMVLSKAADTEIVYNGATLTSNNTSIEVAGVTLNLLGTTAAGESVNVTVSNDTSAVYDTIKEFITEYNSILKTMNTYYDAASASSYEVLTDEQKEAMSDDEVDKWNTKIKDSLLRRDSTLSSLISVMKTDMMGSYKASNGKTYSLANLGISTSSKNYNEGGLLHIKGDEDDDEFADSTNTLMKMLEEDPDTVKEVLSGLASNLYDSLNKKMSTSTMSSALTFYNDKEMASQLSDYKKEISNWESKLSDMEEKYYSQFSAMETALAKLQSQQNTLSSYLGS
ncbi:MAG: flagellar filament capping protein FliD [Butyribacter sp.]|jgi:flagellar hook-associated protein 2 C-terminal domain protein|uniref:flagellar filament capping protein FliD n=1 Tax=Butyribacter sp. TaxID=2822465 RepID=UPI00399CDD6F